MCGMFHFMTFQSGAHCFNANEIFILKPTELAARCHSLKKCTILFDFFSVSIGVFFACSLYFNHRTSTLNIVWGEKSIYS